MASDGFLFALIGIAVFLLLILVAIRLLKSVLREESTAEPGPHQSAQSRNRESDASR